MAGAVSAGAYTAGVMDFLWEALSNWEQQKGQPDVPTHQVQIPIMGGASAGGMTTLIAAAVAHKKFAPVRWEEVQANPLAQQPQNPFYHAWVDLEGDDMFSKMMSLSDLKGEATPSLLNSDFIDRIAAKMIQSDGQPGVLPSFVAHDLEFFSTLTNLEGFEKKVNFRTANHAFDPHLISWHKDYGCFRLSQKGPKDALAQRQSGNYDGWIPINFGQADAETLQIVREVAMATGAFPGGLKSRKVTRKAEDLNANPWIEADDFPAGFYEGFYVDGGVINNEPFERVKERLYLRTGQTEKEASNFSQSKGTVVMIDPFPSKDKKFEGTFDVLPNLNQTLGAMLGQLRVKNEVLDAHYDHQTIFRYLIAPTRKTAAGENLKGERAIACGFMGGFGGFLSKAFRAHDFFLGRANCERFLREYFTVPVHAETLEPLNPIFKAGYAQVQQKERYLSESGHLSIIPVLTPQRKEGADFKMDWPKQAPNFTETFQPAVKGRVNALIKKQSAQLSWWKRLAVAAGRWIILRRLGTNAVLKTIQNSMEEWGLLPKH